MLTKRKRNEAIREAPKKGHKVSVTIYLTEEGFGDLADLEHEAEGLANRSQIAEKLIRAERRRLAGE